MRPRSGMRWRMGLMRILHATCGITSHRGYGEENRGYEGEGRNQAT